MRSNLSIEYALQRADGTYNFIGLQNNAQDRGVTSWAIPSEIPENTEVFIKLKLEKEVVESHPFGPFIIVGGRTIGPRGDVEKNRPTKEIIDELNHIDSLLKNIRLPGKSWLSDKVSVGTYLYYLINSDELTNYISAANI